MIKSRVIRINLLLFPIILLILLNNSSIFSKEDDVKKQNWLLGVVSKLEKMQDDAIAQIQQNEETIRKLESLIARAKQANDSKTEAGAMQPLGKAREAKKINEWRKTKAEESIAGIRALIAKYSPEEVENKAVLSRFYGTVEYQKKNQKKWESFEQNGKMLIEPGDTIRTAADSRVELYFLEGDGKLIVDSNTSFTVTEDSIEGSILDLSMGAIKCAKSKIQSLKKKLEIKTPTGVMTVRGTELIVSYHQKKGSEIIVLEGNVEVSDTDMKKNVVVNEGYKTDITPDGVISEPYKTDLTKMERWWEDEK